MGIAPQDGRAAISSVETNFPDDHQSLVQLRKDLFKSQDETYLRCLEDRRPTELKKKGKLPRNVMLEFWDACNVKLDTPDMQERLRKEIQATGAMSDAIINELHDEVMELLGYDRAHGHSCFEELSKSREFAKDQELAMCYHRWQSKTSSTCLGLLEEHRKSGGTLNIPEQTREQLFSYAARSRLVDMSLDERTDMLQKWAKKVNVYRNLPEDHRVRYIERLSDEDRLDLATSEVYMTQLKQSQLRVAE